MITVYENFNIPLQLGDEILSLDNIDFTSLSEFDICEYYLNTDGGEKNEVNLTILRNSDTLNYTLKRQIFIK